MIRRLLTASAGLAITATLAPAGHAQGSLFTAVPVDESNFILVAAPIGNGERSQLNIYEQRSDKRPCFAVSGSAPERVDPLLSTFDFTGVCSRYIDGNGYSLRIGGDDLGTRYRLAVLKKGSDIELMALPTRNSSQPALLVARSGGVADGFVKLNFEPAWKLMRRAYGEKVLGHIYVYKDAETAEMPPAEMQPEEMTVEETIEVESEPSASDEATPVE